MDLDAKDINNDKPKERMCGGCDSCAIFWKKRKYISQLFLWFNLNYNSLSLKVLFWIKYSFNIYFIYLEKL